MCFRKRLYKAWSFFTGRGSVRQAFARRSVGTRVLVCVHRQSVGTKRRAIGRYQNQASQSRKSGHGPASRPTDPRSVFFTVCQEYRQGVRRLFGRSAARLVFSGFGSLQIAIGLAPSLLVIACRGFFLAEFSNEKISSTGGMPMEKKRICLEFCLLAFSRTSIGIFVSRKHYPQNSLFFASPRIERATAAGASVFAGDRSVLAMPQPFSARINFAPVSEG